MASETVGIKEEMSIKKTTVTPQGTAVKSMFFFPDRGVSIEAPSMEEALKILSSMDKEVKK